MSKYMLVEKATGRVVQPGEIVLSIINERFEYSHVIMYDFFGGWLYVKDNLGITMRLLTEFPDYQIIETGEENGN